MNEEMVEAIGEMIADEFFVVKDEQPELPNGEANNEARRRVKERLGVDRWSEFRNAESRLLAKVNRRVSNQQALRDRWAAQAAQAEADRHEWQRMEAEMAELHDRALQGDADAYAAYRELVRRSVA